MGTGVPAAEALPEGIVSRDQWLCWRTQERNGKPTKVPVNPHTGSFGSATDSGSWASFEEARAYAIDGAADGMGFVFTDEDPIVGVDLDDCRVPETGTLTGVAPAVVETLVSYTEVSPSGTGVHVLVEATLPDGRNRRGSVEIYETDRFFTVTGDHVDGTPLSIERRHDELLEVYTEHIATGDETSGDTPAETTEGATREPSSSISDEATDLSSETADAPDEPIDETANSNGGSTSSSSRSDLGDAELLERARAAANGEKFSRLWRGDTSGYESHSEADMALCALLAFWSGCDESQIDRLFRESGLMREKWDEPHYADGSTYGEKTIERVIAGTDEFYDPNPESEGGSGHEDSVDVRTSSDTTQADPDVEATILRLREERDALVAREQEHLELIDDLRAQVERLEAENERLHAELDELRETTTGADAGTDTEATTPSTATRFWQWVTGDGTE
ncbi:hypothetical protein ACFQE8_14840 [Salinirubellus sp. GCM10025818]|uniref:phage NrS-1 polymerase family protein n=1 Tax=Salinirubellus TaxID=2162630 RepID=UPI0030CB8874